ncbi:MAG TPA: hypothetical protein VGI39_06475 [Polyangiaceae bacterium]
MTWVRGAAIRPVPAYAVVPEATLSAVEEALAREDESEPSGVDEAFQRFERTQPSLADTMNEVLQKPIDETALALGYFLSIAIWLAFEKTFGDRLAQVTDDATRATEAALALEEELRATHSDEPLEIDDVVAMEQPGVLAFVHEHVEAALDPHGESGREVDVDDVHMVYRAILVLTLALSHAVKPVGGAAGTGKELLA